VIVRRGRGNEASQDGCRRIFVQLRQAEALWSDYHRGGRQDKPSFLKESWPAGNLRLANSKARTGVPKRQRRHLV